MKKTLLAAAAAMPGARPCGALAQASDTLNKIKDSGTVTMGVRESSGAAGLHARRRQVRRLPRRRLPAASPTSRSSSAWPSSTSSTSRSRRRTASRWCRTAPSTSSAARPPTTRRARRTSRSRRPPTSRKCASPSRPTRGITGIADLNGKTVATTTGTTSVQLLRKNERAPGHRLQGSLSARTTPTASCCSSPAAPTRS